MKRFPGTAALCALGLLVASASAQASPTSSLLNPYVLHPTGCYPRALAAGDVTGDGLADVVLTTAISGSDSSTCYKAFVYAQLPDGSLAAPVLYPTGGSYTNRPESVSIGDVNGDGRNDVVVGDQGGGIDVLRQNAGGTLDPRVAYATANGHAVAVGDLNHDGRNDVAGIGFSSGQVDVYLQDGSGALSAPVRYQAPYAGFNELLAGDVNSDGLDDLVVMSGQGFAPSLQVLRQQGDGTLGNLTSYSVGSNRLTHDVALGDANGDGHADMVVTYDTTGRGVALFAQDGNGGLSSPTLLGTVLAPMPIVVADINEDGRADVVAAHDYSLGVLLQNPDGSLAAEQSYELPHTDAVKGPRTLAVADVNGDGHADVVLTDSFSGLLVLTSTLGDTLPPAVTVTAPAGSTFYTGTSATVQWTATDDGQLAGFVVFQSLDGGATYNQLSGMLSAGTRSFTYTPYGTATAQGRIKVVATDTAGHQGSGTGAFQLVSSQVAVTAPAAGDAWRAATPQDITWTATLAPGATVAISLSRDGGTSWTTLAGAAPNTGRYSWTVSGPGTTRALVRLYASGVTATTGQFTIYSPAVTLTSPAAGAVWYVGQSKAITWTSTDLPVGATVDIELSGDGGATWTPVTTAAASSASYTWTVMPVTVQSQSLRVAWSTDHTVASSRSLSILQPAITMQAPAAGDGWLTGTGQTIRWQGTLPSGATVDVDLSRDGGATWTSLAASTPSTGQLSWTVAAPASSNARVRVCWTGDATVCGTTPAFAVLDPAIVLNAPQPGSTLFIGTQQSVSWTATLPASGTVDVQYSGDGGGTWSTLASGLDKAASFSWAIDVPASDTASLRVCWTANLSVCGSLSFVVVTPSLSLTAPATGATWWAGTTQSMAWTSRLPAGALVDVDLSRDGGSTFTPLASHVAADPGTLSWAVSGPATSQGLVRVSSTAQPAVSASVGVAIVVPSISIGAPATWYAGTTETITWMSSNLPAGTAVNIDLSRDGGLGWTRLASALADSGKLVVGRHGPGGDGRADPRLGRQRPRGQRHHVPLPDPGAHPGRAVTGRRHDLGGDHRAVDRLDGHRPACRCAGRRLPQPRWRNSWTSLGTAPAGAGSLPWTVSGPATGSAVARVSWTGVAASSGAFTITLPSITLTTPAGGETWVIGATQTIAWSASLPAGSTVNLEVSRDGGVSWSPIGSFPASAGVAAWTVTSPTTGNARVRASWTGTPAVSSAGGPLAIVNPSLTLTAPVTAVTVSGGSPMPITWTSNLGSAARVDVLLSRDGGSTWTVLVNGAPNTGTWTWTVAGSPTKKARIRVRWTANTVVSSQSPLNFTIR